MVNRKNIEVEIRGPLSCEEFDYFLNFFKEKAVLLKKGKQNVFLFQENKILNIKKDRLRIIQTSNSEKICFKTEKDINSNEEIEFFLKKGEYLKAISFFKRIGFLNYSKAPSERYDFLYKKIQISLKRKCIIGPHYEMEILVNKEKDIHSARDKLSILANQLGLKVWNDEDYKKHRSHMWGLYKNRKKNSGKEDKV